MTLPDAWAGRWPAHDGVVWYRLRWSEPATAGAPAPRGLAMDYLSMAGAIYLNGALLARDPQLEEPLSRSWNHPRHWLLSAPLLRPGPNELLVRVSGLAAYAPGKFDCLVTDLHMPGLGGLELQQKLRALGSSIPVIVVTSAADSLSRSRAMEEGAFAYLTKPVGQDALLHHLTTALAGRTAAGEGC